MNENLDAKEVLEYYKSIVWPIIDKHLTTPSFPHQFKVTELFQDEIDYYWKIARDYPERKGKYVRPTVLIVTALAMGARLDEVLNVAAAMQISEEWILVQDDWEDESEIRRGDTTLHKKYPEKLAINASTGLHISMWNLLTKNFSKMDVAKSIQIQEEFNLMLTRTVFGQHSDIDYVEKNILDYTDDDWFFIADSKTSYYTVAGPIRLGAMCAGADEEQLNLLTNFGQNLGRCFQLTDDILDVTSDFSGLKQVGNDIYESKRTLILGHLLRETKDDDKKELIRIISKKRKDKTEDEVRWVMEKMNEYGSIEYAKKLAVGYKEKAEKILHNDLSFLNKEPHRSHLETLMNFILNRKH